MGRRVGTAASGLARLTPPPCDGLPDGFGNPSLMGPTGFAQTEDLRDEIIEYGDSVVDRATTRSIDRRFRAVVEQLQTK